ncbi:hypothetical protein D3C76_1677950 [compost metagenome]
MTVLSLAFDLGGVRAFVNVPDQVGAFDYEREPHATGQSAWDGVLQVTRPTQARKTIEETANRRLFHIIYAP